MHRRRFITAAGIIAASSFRPEKSFAADSQSGSHGIGRNLLDAFKALPGGKSCRIDVDDPRGAWRVAYEPDLALFCGSCFKTFVLATYLREVEAGRLSEDEQLRIDDDIRSVGGGVFEFLSGTTSARIVLEAMIAHSDNTATDVAMRRVGAEKVREFVKMAGLTSARIPDSTRRFFSYVTGYPTGVDMGWKGLQDMQANKSAGVPRPVINDQQTMVCSASDFVTYYKRALSDEFFQKKETLTEFKRILAMADSICRRGSVGHAGLSQRRQHRLERLSLHGHCRTDDCPEHTGDVLPESQLDRTRRH